MEGAGATTAGAAGCGDGGDDFLSCRLNAWIDSRHRCSKRVGLWDLFCLVCLLRVCVSSFLGAPKWQLQRRRGQVGDEACSFDITFESCDETWSSGEAVAGMDLPDLDRVLCFHVPVHPLLPWTKDGVADPEEEGRKLFGARGFKNGGSERRIALVVDLACGAGLGLCRWASVDAVPRGKGKRVP